MSQPIERAGTIARLVADKGFGFIHDSNSGTDFFFHRSAVLGADFDELFVGQDVTFTEEISLKGPRCARVTP